jgi:hypothetical protein
MTRPRRTPGRGPWALVALGLAVFAAGVLYGHLSPGTYQDDDVDRYYMSRQALQDPALFLNRWGMPLPLLVFAVPAALGGHPGVEAAAALCTALAALFCVAAARRLGYALPLAAGVWFAAQPLVLELSFAALGEPVAALVLAALLWAWYARRPGLAVGLSGLLPLARIDGGLLTAVCLAAGWRRAGRAGRALALAPLLVWNLLGFLQTKDPFYVLSLGSQRPLTSLGPWHHVRNGIVVVGPIVLFFLVWALVVWWERRPDRPRRPAFALLLLAVHTLELALLGWEGLPFGRSIGFLRHIVVSSPAVALVAAWGALDWADPRRRPRALRLAVALGWPVVVALFLSRRLLSQAIVTQEQEPWRWITTAILGALGAVFLLRSPGRRALAAAALGAALLAFLVVKPIGLDPEREAMRQAVEQIRTWGMLDRVVHTNHPWFAFLTGRDRYDSALTPPLRRETLESGRPGSFYLWENHYGYRRWGGDVPLQALLRDSRFLRVLELRAGTPDTFRVVLFVKER